MRGIETIEALLPSNGIITVFTVLTGIAAVAFWAWLDRIPGMGTRLWAFLTGSWLVAVVTAWIAGVVAISDVLRAGLVLVGTQAGLFAIVIWIWQTDSAADPRIREEDGKPQFEDRDRRSWERLLTFSPIHIARYHRYLREEGREDVR